MCWESTCASTLMPFRDPEDHLRVRRVFLKAGCERVAWSWALQKLLKPFTSVGLCAWTHRVFENRARLHSSFVGVSGSWTLTWADRETDLHRNLLAPRLYLENPVRARAASKWCEVVRSFGQVCVCARVNVWELWYSLKDKLLLGSQLRKKCPGCAFTEHVVIQPQCAERS